MKIIKYTLKADGTVPTYIVDGGYFPVENNKEFPQNLDLVGLATDDATEISFVTSDELIKYAKDNGVKEVVPVTNEVVTAETLANNLWEKFSNLMNGTK